VDYWALGVLIFEMVTGYSPFAGPDHASAAEAVIMRNIMRCNYDRDPEEAENPQCLDIIDKLLSHDQSRR
jgi:serine/threonine protein kinase